MVPAEHQDVLAPGVWVVLWPGNGQRWHDLEPRYTAPFLAECNVTGVIAHSEKLQSPGWCTPERVMEFGKHGLKVAVGVGFLYPAYRTRTRNTMLEALAVCARPEHPTVGVYMDWIEVWNGHHTEAEWLVNELLTAHPDAARYCTDCPWWAPLTTPSGNPSHPSAPHKSFLKLARKELYTQCYGAPIPGESERMLKWARDPSQWARLGKSPDRVRATVQAYHRTLKDHLRLLLTEQTIVYWNWAEMDDIARYALRVRAAIERVGSMGPDSIAEFQRFNGLRPDGVVGPLTGKALGLGDPPKGD